MSVVTTNKACRNCGETKPLSEFYPNPSMADGHLNQCKECKRRDMRRRNGSTGPKPLTLRERVYRCVEEEPGSGVADIRAMLAEVGIAADPAVIATTLARLTDRGVVTRQPMRAGRREVFCYRLPEPTELPR